MNLNNIANSVAPQLNIPKIENPLIKQVVKLLDAKIEKTPGQQNVVDTILSVMGMAKPKNTKPAFDHFKAVANVRKRVHAQEQAYAAIANKTASADLENIKILTKYAEGFKSYCDKQGLDGSEIVEELFDGQIQL